MDEARNFGRGMHDNINPQLLSFIFRCQHVTNYAISNTIASQFNPLKMMAGIMTEICVGD